MKSAASDSEMMGLIEAAQLGSDQALNELCSRLKPYLEEFCRGRIDGPLRTKIPESDIVQESLLGLTRSFNRFEGQTKAELVAWVRGILVNKSLEMQRRFLGAEKRDLQRECRLNLAHCNQTSDMVSDPLDEPLETMITAEDAARVRNLTDQLPEHYRQVIELRFLKELTFPQIAERMQRTEASVKNIFVRALEVLEKGLEP